MVGAQAAVCAGVGAAVVNGPEGGTRQEGTPRRGVSMRQARENVRRLRQRIFKAAQAGDRKKVRSLQKLTAPRGVLSYPRYSREELEGRFLGLMAYLDPKR
jgi:hypothetical protein